jgi:hypothetical protein
MRALRRARGRSVAALTAGTSRATSPAPAPRRPPGP